MTTTEYPFYLTSVKHDNLTVFKPFFYTRSGAAYYVSQYGSFFSRNSRGKTKMLKIVKEKKPSPAMLKSHGKEYKYRRIQIFERYSINGKSYYIMHKFLAHRIVAMIFCSKKFALKGIGFDNTLVYNQIDHLDNNPANNRWDNLQWVSPAVNTRRRNAYYNAIKNNHPFIIDGVQINTKFNSLKFHVQ